MKWHGVIRVSIRSTALALACTCFVISACEERQPDQQFSIAADACPAETPGRKSQTGECVECTEDAHCMNPAKSRCDEATNTCLPCGDPAECSHLGNLAICRSGTCVQCTDAEDSACGGTVCDVSAGRCSDKEPGKTPTCEPCVSDKQCVAQHRCVPMKFGNTDRPGGYCLKSLSSGCAVPFGVQIPKRASLSNPQATDTYCGIDENTTTCEAVLDLKNNKACKVGDAPPNADLCGAPGLDDGRCASVNGLADRCTYGCTLANQCPDAAGCNAGYCGGPAS